MNHGFHADAVVFLNAIAVAGDWSPIGEFAAGAENVFFFIGAEKIGAVFVPECDVMKDNAGDCVAGCVDEMRVIGKQPAGDGNAPDQVRRLRHFHV